MIQHGGSAFPGEQEGGGSTGGPGSSGSASGGATRTRPDETDRSGFGAFLDDLSDPTRRDDRVADLRDGFERRVSRARARMSEAFDHGAARLRRARRRTPRSTVSRLPTQGAPMKKTRFPITRGALVAIVQSGVTPLSGFAKSQAEKDRASALAREARCVKAVRNDIVVRP